MELPCFASRSALQVGEHFVRMPFRFDVIENVLDLAIGANDKCCPGDPFDLLAVHVLFFHHAE